MYETSENRPYDEPPETRRSQPTVWCIMRVSGRIIGRMRSVTRSQPILRLPVETVDAVMILHDGERSNVALFVPPSEDISRVLTGGNAFVAMTRSGEVALVARSTIASFGVASELAPRLEDFPSEQQRVTVKLRSGVVLEGVMRWIAPPGQQRTVDHLNDESPYVVLRTGEIAYVVVKSHIAMVTES